MPADDRTAASGRIDAPALLLEWSEAPWDTVLFGAPVLQVTELQVRGDGASSALAPFLASRDRLGSPFVSCRLAHERLRESMLLEQHGFRFIEMLFHPEYGDLQDAPVSASSGLVVRPATQQDMEHAVAAAGQAFRNERFHVDPRLPRGLGDLRYQNWVRSSMRHPTQRLLAICDGDGFVGFFIVELLADGTCYWHLTAIAPERQGQGYGARVWSTMLAHARDSGAQRVRTSIVARNHRVMNLYARLGFRFSPPAMTFHWIRGQ